METITPTFILLLIFGICPSTFDKFRIIYSLITLIMLITLSIGWIYLQLYSIAAKHNVNQYTTIMSISAKIGFISGNLFYGLTLFITRFNYIKYNQFINQILNQSTFSNRKISIETNSLAIYYTFIIISNGFLWMEDYTIHRVLYQIIYAWFFIGINLSAIYIRYVTVILLKLLNQIVSDFRNVRYPMKNSTNFYCVLKTFDEYRMLQQKYENLFQKQLTINIFNSSMEICISSFMVFVFGERNYLQDVIFGIFLYILPDMIVLSTLVCSINQFGSQVRQNKKL